MTHNQIKTLKRKIDLHKDTLSTMDLQLDMIYDALKILIRMGAGDILIGIWLEGLEREIGAIEDAINIIEKENSYDTSRA